MQSNVEIIKTSVLQRMRELKQHKHKLVLNNTSFILPLFGDFGTYTVADSRKMYLHQQY